MTTQLRVTCINKADRFNPNRHITHIGGFKADGSRYRFSEEEALRYMKQQLYSFYVIADSKRVEVIPFYHLGREYLKTEADGIVPNNLLSLPECPLW